MYNVMDVVPEWGWGTKTSTAWVTWKAFDTDGNTSFCLFRHWGNSYWGFWSLWSLCINFNTWLWTSQVIIVYCFLTQQAKISLENAKTRANQHPDLCWCLSQLEDTSVVAADYGNGSEGRRKIYTVDMKLVVFQEITLQRFYVLINSDLPGRSWWMDIWWMCVKISNHDHEMNKFGGESNTTTKCINIWSR